MLFPGFTDDDFDLFAIPDFAGRMGEIRSRLRPKLLALGEDLAGPIERAVEAPVFPHVAQHMRRRVNPPAETWAAFARDRKGYKRWTKPFVVFGMNAIAAFFLSAVIARSLNLIKVAGPAGTPISLKSYIFSNAFTPFFSPLNASLAYAITYDLMLLGILWVMYRRKIFIKL